MPEGERHVETIEIILIALKDVLQRERFNRTYRRGIKLLIVYCAHATINTNCGYFENLKCDFFGLWF